MTASELKRLKQPGCRLLKERIIRWSLFGNRILPDNPLARVDHRFDLGRRSKLEEIEKRARRTQQVDQH
jgi:hypothetical protein